MTQTPLCNAASPPHVLPVQWHTADLCLPAGLRQVPQHDPCISCRKRFCTSSWLSCTATSAVKLGPLHSALRRTVGTLPSPQPTLIQDVCALRDGILTRREQAAAQSRQRRSNSFAVFRAAHPAMAIEAMKLRYAMPVVPRIDEVNAAAALQWLPLCTLKRLCVEPSTSASGLAKVHACESRLCINALRLELTQRQSSAV